MLVNLNYTFFLGGQDLEMVEIASLLRQQKVPYHDKGLKWGAKASDYAEELLACDAPVLVELAIDMPLPNHCIIIDHHGEKGHEACSLRQVYNLLELQNWTRRFSLIEANDVGHIDAMLRFGASLDEIQSIRREDRRAQGITLLQEQAGMLALARAQTIAQKLTLVHLPHSHAATVTDDYALSGNALPLLIVSAHEVNFYGSGHVITRLNESYQGGWCGGELPKRGFWGKNYDIVPEKELVSFVLSFL